MRNSHLATLSRSCWFEDSNSKIVCSINFKLDIEVEHDDSLYGIAFGDESGTAK